MKGPRPRVALIPEGPRTPLAQGLASLLNNGNTLVRALRPLPLSRVDHSAVGTRGLCATSPMLPGKILRFSGIGVVATDAGVMTLRRPEPETPVSAHHKMGTLIVAADGSIWSQRNHSAFGAYALDDLRTKLERTRRFAAPTDLEVLAAGEHEGTGLGWLIYSLPAEVETPVEVAARDLALPREQLGSLYGPAVQALLARTRALHQAGVVHRQLHPGNWFVRMDGPRPQVSITDWGTAGKVEELPAPGPEESHPRTAKPDLEARLAGLSAAEKVMALDVYSALLACTLIDSPQVIGRFSAQEQQHLPIAIGPLGAADDIMQHHVRLAAWAIDGYLGMELGAPERARLTANLQARFEEIAVAMTHQMNRPLPSYSAIVADERPWMTFRPALADFLLRIAQACVSRPREALLMDLLANASCLARDRLPSGS